MTCVLIRQSGAEGEACHRKLSAAHALPRRAPIFSEGKGFFFFFFGVFFPSPCAVVREGARGVLKCLSLFSWQSFFSSFFSRVWAFTVSSSTSGMRFNRWRF